MKQHEEERDFSSSKGGICDFIFHYKQYIFVVDILKNVNKLQKKKKDNCL